MDEPLSSQVKVSEDKPTGIASHAHGANIDALAFNMGFIASKNPTLAIQIMKLYGEASKIAPADPPYPEEDFSAALDGLKDLFD